ncbi:hypothetical protein H072_4636 [Dactylellina haptotyla CBS 200.50]|uniref:Apple domain-containing protein n=1 Tax=Dactylellina haptotyla (strain CBS 200.50) TaxID=1284197 RepID=S8C1M0_DACHA|nr:hypothetical protein H072_4636 [Dactylellina haptotyla CBS 200.50]
MHPLSSLLVLGAIAPFTLGYAVRGRVLAIDVPEPVLQERGVPVCNVIQGFVNLLKAKGATSFCSSYLDIQTITVTASATVQTYTTTTTTIQETVTATVTAATEAISFSETIVTATLPTTVSTNTIIVPSTSIVYSTPVAATTTTTIYYTAGVAKPRAVELEERAIQLPPYVAGFASAAISSGCSCLSIPTPTTTVTTTSTNPNTIQTQTTKTETDTKYVTLTVSTTITAGVITYTPVTAQTTSTNVVISTSTLPQQTTTVTTTVTIRPQCTAILSGKRLYEAIGSNRILAAYNPTNEARVPGDGTMETTQSACCELCYNYPGCIYYSVVPPTSTGQLAICRQFYNFQPVPEGVTPMCPQGRPSYGTTLINRRGTYEVNKAYGIGPCLGLEPPVPA